MAARVTKKGFNKKEFIEACQEMGSEKGISDESLLDALNESFRVTFAKKIESEYKVDLRASKNSKAKDKTTIKLPDALIRTDIDLAKGKINVYHQWEVVTDDDVEDDYLQIGLEEAKEKNHKLGIGDFYEEELDISTLSLGDIGRFMSCFKQKISKAEKDALLEAFASKIGTIVTGEVDKADGHCVIVDLGRTTATLFQKDLIGDERFNQGDSIKVFVEGIGKDDKKGSLIKISRSCPGFLRKLFENEIHEIYDGTVIIKDIQRIAGKRSKVAVYSKDPNVDPSGACIGTNGSRIQSIVSQLGNAKDNKEKIDVVTYSPNLGVYVSELLKPGKVLGMVIDEEAKAITVVCTNDTSTSAIGIKGTNVILARKMTGYSIEILDLDSANEKGITASENYKTLDVFEAEAREDAKVLFRMRQEELNKNKTTDEDSTVENNEMFIDKDIDDEPIEELSVDTMDDLTEKDIEGEVKAETAVQEVKEEPKPKVKEEPVYNDAPVYKKEEEVIEHSEAKTTITLESLEKSLEEEKKNKEQKTFKKKSKKDDKKQEESFDEDLELKPVHKMDIYTDEELQELDAELDDLDSYDEEDYSDYDSDDYYEDK